MTPNDLSAYWMPFTANRQFRKAPLLIASAEGMHYTLNDGRRILDSVGGLWCVNAGHCHPRIIAAIRDQAWRLDYVPTFSMGFDAVYAYANRLTALMPAGMDHLFLGGSGSDAVETALKIALAYQKARGQPGRTILVGREKGYHGMHYGGLGVGGIDLNRAAFAPMLPNVAHLPHTLLPGNAFSMGEPEAGADLADALEDIVAQHGAVAIAAVIVEPVAGAGGVIVPPKGYLARLRALCSRHDILLIFDEVVTGFGRLGTLTASEYFDVVPDMICLAKGITSGAVPMGGVVVADHIRAAFDTGPEHMIELFHGYTYSGHPLAVAAADAALSAYLEDGIFAHAARMARPWAEAAHALRGSPHVKDIRTLGLLCGIELESDEHFIGHRGKAVGEACLAEGKLVRQVGDTLIMSPPLVIDEAQTAALFDTVARALAQVA